MYRFARFIGGLVKLWRLGYRDGFDSTRPPQRR